MAEARWQSPIGDAPELTDEQRDDGKFYNWNEADQQWDLTDGSV